MMIIVEFMSESMQQTANKAPHVKFGINTKLEIPNIYYAVNRKPFHYDFSRGVDAKLASGIKGRGLDKARPLIQSYVEKYYASNRDRINLQKREFEKVWRPIEKKVFDKMKEVTHRKFPYPLVYAFITIIGRCDYDPLARKPYYKVPLNINSEFVPDAFVHELLHFIYHYYDEPNVLKELTKNESEDLKESLTFLINSDFGSIFATRDWGYPIHKQLRKQLQEFWQKHKDYDALLQEGIKLIKAHRRRNEKRQGKRL